MSLLLHILGGLLLLGALARAIVEAYRMGFRAAIDFLDGRRPLPGIIISWRRALQDRNNETSAEADSVQRTEQ
jgi:hypothetical protein